VTKAAALLKERICGDAGRYFRSGIRAAHGNHLNLRKPAPDNREQLKAGHSRHIEVGDEHFRDFAPDLN
jgi:hypothetical protein